MNIGYISDVHDEHRKIGYLPKNDIYIDVLILAGDITSSREVVNYLIKTQAEWRVQVLFVPGNHDYYRQDVTNFTQFLKNKFEFDKNIHILQNSSTVISDVSFHGSTLWTGFDGYKQSHTLSKKLALMNVQDFYSIWQDGRIMTPDTMENNYQDAKKFLQKSLSLNSGKKQVIVTHFPPDPRLNICRPMDSLSPYFYANCAEIFKAYSPNLWIYGHSHCSTKMKINDTFVCSNQVGYPHEQNRALEVQVFRI